MTNNTSDIPPVVNARHMEGMDFLKTIDDGSVDLILTDPPYIISRDSGMNAQFNLVQDKQAKNIKYVKTEEEWVSYKESNTITNDDKKELYMQYGSIYGKKYSVQTDYGKWDSEFTMEMLDAFISQYYKKLRTGGTLIMFFDLWKLTDLKNLLEKNKFKQLRFIEWIKTNPQPLNSRVNYLTNCREIALIGVKGGKPTFHSHQDNGIYHYPLQGGKNRFHPTQKSLPLFEELVEKHSNPGDLVMDTFLGSGTTALACKKKGRRFCGCEINENYYQKLTDLLSDN